jgi:hypothetical protein
MECWHCLQGAGIEAEAALGAAADAEAAEGAVVDAEAAAGASADADAAEGAVVYAAAEGAEVDAKAAGGVCAGALAGAVLATAHLQERERLQRPCLHLQSGSSGVDAESSCSRGCQQDVVSDLTLHSMLNRIHYMISPFVCLRYLH